MKKLPLLLALAFIMLCAFRAPSPFILNFSKEDIGTTVYFIVQNHDEHNATERLSAALGKPGTSTTGTMSWKHLDIGVAKDITITIKDGIFTSNPDTKTGSWVLFSSEADKKDKLAHLTGNQYRETHIEITDKDGRPFVSDGVIEHRLQAFLEARIQF